MFLFQKRFLPLGSVVVISVFLFLACILGHAQQCNTEQSTSKPTETIINRRTPRDSAKVPLEGTYQQIDGFFGENDIEVVYQAPRDPKGILFLAHGCSHSATDWWPASKSCPTCIGLPIETGISQGALRRGWVALAISSKDRRSKCWSGSDLPRIKRAVSHIRTTFKLGAASPLSAFGASSGGAIVSALGASQIKGIVGVVSQIMSTQGAISRTHPPVRFVHMALDDVTAARVQENVEGLQRVGVDAAELVVYPHPVVPEVFGARGGGGRAALPAKMAKNAVRVLEQAGFLDDSGLLKKDPRRSDWRTVLRPVIPKGRDSFIADKSPVSEVLNAAWAKHEICDEYLEVVLDWLDQKTHEAEERVKLKRKK